MAQIDLKKAQLFLIDGYTGIDTDFAVNLTAGYTAGATTMVVDTGTGQIPVGDRFTVAGDTVIHTVTATVETTGNTTSITFTPALGANVDNDALITFLPHRLEIKIGEGNMTFSEKITREYIKDRGRLDIVRNGDEEPIDVRFDGVWEFLKADTGDTPTLRDVLFNIGEAADWVTVDTDACQPYALKVVVYYDPECSGENKEKVTLDKFRHESFDSDLRQGTFSVSGKSNVTLAEVQRASSFAI